MVVQFILLHTLFGKSLSPPSIVGYLWQNKPSALEKVKGGLGARDYKHMANNVGNRQMSLMLGDNTNDHNRTQRPHTVL